MHQFIRRLQGSSFLRYNFIFFTGSIAVSFLNYLYYPVLGRLMPPAGFGEVQALISFFLQTAVFLQVLGMVTIGVIKKYEDPSERNAVTVELEWLALLAGAAAFIVIVLASPWLQSFLRFDSLVPFILFALAVFLGIPLALSNAFLQGLKRFGAVVYVNLTTSGVKLVISAGLVALGFGTGGAMLGLVVASAIAVAYSYHLATRAGRPRFTWLRRWPNLALIRPELRYAGLVFVTSLVVNVSLSIDIIAVKHFFPPAVAGLYAGIATIARIIFFITGPFVPVLVAAVSLRDPATNRALLIRSLALLTLLGGATLVAFTLAPQFIITILLGSKYLAYSAQLPRLSLAIFILSVANLLVSYYVALRRRRVALAAAIGLLSMVILLGFQHQSVGAVVTSLIEGSLTFLILVVVVISWNIKPRRAAL